MPYNYLLDPNTRKALVDQVWNWCGMCMDPLSS